MSFLYGQNPLQIISGNKAKLREKFPDGNNGFLTAIAHSSQYLAVFYIFQLLEDGKKWSMCRQLRLNPPGIFKLLFCNDSLICQQIDDRFEGFHQLINNK